MTNTVVGETYTMVLQITSTCQNEVEIAFSGHDDWFKSYVPANAKAETIKHFPIRFRLSIIRFNQFEIFDSRFHILIQLIIIFYINLG